MSSEEVGADLCPIMVEVWFIRDKSAEAVEPLGCDRQVATISFPRSPSCLGQTGIWWHSQSLDDLAGATEEKPVTSHLALPPMFPVWAGLGWTVGESTRFLLILVNFRQKLAYN